MQNKIDLKYICITFILKFLVFIKIIHFLNLQFFPTLYWLINTCVFNIFFKYKNNTPMIYDQSLYQILVRQINETENIHTLICKEVLKYKYRK